MERPAWHARWIWHGRPPIVAPTLVRPELDAASGDRFVLFRRRLVLGPVPRSVPARVTADSRYRLLVNGVPVAHGPIRGDPRRLHYDCVELSPHLRTGENMLAAVVRFYGRPVAWWSPVPPSYSLGGGAFLFEAAVGTDLVLSDRTWQSQAGDAWSALPAAGVGGHVPEVADGADWDPSWALPAGQPDGSGSGETSTWGPARELVPVHVGNDGRRSPPTHPFGPLLPSPLPPRPVVCRRAVVLDRRRVAGGAASPDPVLQVEADEATPDHPSGAVELVTLDFGQVVAGTLRLEVEGAPGTQLDASCAESLRADGTLARLGQHTGLRYRTRGGAEQWTAFDPLGTRYLRVAVRGEATLEAVVEEALRPRPGGASFECDDERLQAIFGIGLRTVDLCAQDAYVDCPTREQRAWTGDSVVHQMVDLATNPDWSLACHHPVLAACPRPDGMLPMAVAGDFAHYDNTFIPDWSLHWVRSVHNLYRWTGDRELVASLLSVAEGVVRWFVPFQRDDGLLHDVTGWVLIDWSSLYTSGASSALNALWARALGDVAEMATWLGDHGRAAWARARRAEVAAGFEAFWDARRGVYVDHVVDGRRGLPAAQHGGSAALAAHLVPARRRDLVVGGLLDRSRLVRRSWAMDTVTPEGDSSGLGRLALPPPPPDWDAETQMVEAQPFFRYVLHDGVAAAGRARLLAGLCLDWDHFVARGETTWPECWVGGTHCHAWSSTPTRDLVWYVAGITPATPGFGVVRVAPRLGHLRWLRCRAPTPAGFVTVEDTPEGVEIESPVAVDYDPGAGAPAVRLAPGQHRLAATGRPPAVDGAG